MKTAATSAKNRFKSLKHFVQDGLWSSVCEGLAENNFGAFAVFISASASEIGFLSSGQQLLGCWFQLWSEKLIGWCGSRKRLVLGCVALQSFFVGLLTIGVFRGWGFSSFAACAIFYTAFGSLSSPAWNAWVSDLLPGRRRGECFAIRNQRTYPASFLSIVAGGLLLDQLGAARGGQLAFGAVFLLGHCAKLCALYHLVRQQEHAVKVTAIRALGPLALAREAWSDRKIRRMVSFFGAMTFAVNLSGPFQAPYLLRSLHFTYLQYTFLLGVMVIGRFLAAPFVGRIVDRIGSRKLLTISAALLPFSPLTWCLSQNYYVLVASFFSSGLVWAAYDMCSFTYLVECVPSHKRPRVFAARQVTNSLLAFLGAAVGGVLLEMPLGKSSILISGFGFTAGSLVVFWASAIARGLAALSVLRIPHGSMTAESMPQLQSQPETLVEAA